jgi:hypothetical protein
MIASGTVLEVEAPSKPESTSEDQAVPVPLLFETALQKHGRRVVLEVDSVWTGPEFPRVELLTAANEAGCGVPFKVGESYVVFVNRFPGGTYETNLCVHTKPTAQAGEELKALGAARWRPTPSSEQTRK